MTQSQFWKRATTSLSLIFLGGGVALGGNYLINSSQSIAQEKSITQQTNNVATANKATNVVQKETTEPAIAVPQNYVSQVVQNVGNSVVRIDVSRTVSTNASPMMNDPFFRQFFGDQIPEIPKQQVQRGFGSGFIVSSDGLILTNAHVVDGSDQVKVTLKDGRTLEGKVMGSD
ncbi:MAG: trypsin-like peptidase domain-containing protein, partial [Waterburya sp.]